MMRILGKEWANFTQEQRRKYDNMAKQGKIYLLFYIYFILLALDKERFESEMNEFNNNGGTSELLSRLKEKRPK